MAKDVRADLIEAAYHCNIRLLRYLLGTEEKAMPQSHLARILETDKSVIQRWENSKPEQRRSPDRRHSAAIRALVMERRPQMRDLLNKLSDRRVASLRKLINDPYHDPFNGNR